MAVFGNAASGAPFHVYTPSKFRQRLDLRTRSYAVAAGARLHDSWQLDGFENGVYHLRVCGPNGFLREFAAIPQTRAYTSSAGTQMLATLSFGSPAQRIAVGHCTSEIMATEAAIAPSS